MKKLIMIITVCVAMFAQAGWFGIITTSDVKDAFLRSTWYHSGVGDFVPSSVVVEKTETENVWRISWHRVLIIDEKYVESHYENGKWVSGGYKKLNPPQKEIYKESKLFHVRKGKNVACVLTAL